MVDGSAESEQTMNESPRVQGVTLVVPCYNEATRLDVAALAEFAAGQPGLRFLLVNDGSTDATAEVIGGLAARMPGSFEALPLDQNRGKAEAVRRGMLAALRGAPRYVGFWDADLATPLDALPGFYELLASRPEIDLVMGARVRLLGREIERRAARHYIGRAFATAVSLVLHLPTYDTQCGAKLFRASDELARILARPFFTRWLFDVELLARLRRGRRNGRGAALERSIYEMPLVRWRDVPGSKLQTRDFLRAFLDLTRIWVWLHTRAPRPRPLAGAEPQVEGQPAGAMRSAAPEPVAAGGAPGAQEGGRDA